MVPPMHRKVPECEQWLVYVCMWKGVQEGLGDHVSIRLPPIDDNHYTPPHLYDCAKALQHTVERRKVT